MIERIWSKRTAVVTLLFLLIAILLLVMPPEATLGNKVRLVYFHASIAETSIIFFFMSGIASLVYLILKREGAFLRARSFFKVAFYLWILQTVFGAVNMKVIWGNFFWQEPKAKMGLVLLAASLVSYLATELFHTAKAAGSALYLACTGLAVYSLLLASNVFHPENAIFGSDVLAYKVIFVVISLSWFLISLLWSESVYRDIAA